MINIIERNRSIIPACDVNLDIFKKIIEKTADIPNTANQFMDSIVKSGINAVILFPKAGPVTEYE
tara:strand:- start:11044 stop:11238 length:195 start_codon:yes stop_codon:yes gene_type:complete